MDLIERAQKAGLMSEEDYLRLAAFAGDQDKIRIHYEKTKELESSFSLAASLGDQVGLLQWLHDNGAKMMAIMEGASQMGSRGAIEWALGKGIEFTDDCMWRAILTQNFETLRWLKEKGCPVTRKCYDAVAKASIEKPVDLAVLNWLFESGCTFGPNEVMAAVSAKSLPMLTWYHERDPEVKPENFMVAACQVGSIEVLDWGLKNGYTLTTECMKEAACKSTLDTMEWLHEHGCPCNEDAYTCLSHSKGGSAVRHAKFDWLESVGCPFGEHSKEEILEALDHDHSHGGMMDLSMFMRMMGGSF